ncbi:carbohydrate-binding protein [Streptomyces fragilis]|uniref:Carbohydrate-binding protein n=1 Tax=Streptomyces fragilis TaxID=67301 RepID=A0ABV2YCZ8_9ACTN|nr:carbohydrate-binding protein [Streptomyces fragilis]
MTSGNNGASTPEDDDPFGYLYADGQANGAQPPTGGGYGYPNSVNRVRAVGERRYGAQQTAQQPAPPAGAGYGRPNPHYQAPEVAMGSVGVPGGPAAGGHRSHGNGGGGRGRGPNTKGLLIGAVAVVAAVVIGISVAIASGDDDADKNASASPSPSVTTMEKPAGSGDKDKGEDDDVFEPFAIEAASLTGGLSGGATPASDVPGSRAKSGSYVAGLNTPGASVTWTVNGVPEDGQYTLFTYYGVPGEDTKATLTVNGGPGAEVAMKNWANAEKGAWDKGWTRTYNYVPLKKGTNTITLTCASGCNANIDQFGLVAGEVKEAPKEFGS